MRVSLSQIGILSYALPALFSVYVTSAYGYDMSESGKTAIFVSVASSVLGYVTSRFFGGVNTQLIVGVKSKTDFAISYALMTIGVVAIVLDFAINMSIPLLMGGVGRVELQDSILWNIYIIGSLGVFIYSRSSMMAKDTALGKVLVCLYLVTSLLSAWKGTLLLNLIMYLIPRLKGRGVPLFRVVKYSTIIGVVLIMMNFMRSSAPLSHVLVQPVFYLTWGFVNFDKEAVDASSDCIHSIPVIGCQFFVDNDVLINPAWNVFTALSPLYIDGGIYLVGSFFYFCSLSLGLAEKSRGTLFNDYVYFVFLYFFLIAHNGYSFYSTSFVASLVFLGIIRFLKIVSRDTSPHIKEVRALAAG